MIQDFIWINTDIPSDLIDTAAEQLENEEDKLVDSKTYGVTNEKARSSKQLWVPEHHWITGFINHFAGLANRNFQYRLTGIHGGALQYTHYKQGDHFDWHVDEPVPDSGDIRKLSFSLQLSEEDSYTGGDLQFNFGRELQVAPKTRGTIVFFDSRLTHRVTKIKSGERRALVGWMGGPRWM